MPSSLFPSFYLYFLFNAHNNPLVIHLEAISDLRGPLGADKLPETPGDPRDVHLIKGQS